MTLFPALAAKIPGGDANTLGWVSAASGSGALLGALYLALWRKPPFFGRLIAWATAAMASGLIVLSWVQSFVAILACVFVCGFGMMLQFAAGNTIIQTVVDDDKRGRVMSFFAFSLMGISPFGNLIIGWLAQNLDLSHTFRIEGICCGVGALIFSFFSDAINREVAVQVSVP